MPDAAGKCNVAHPEYEAHRIDTAMCVLFVCIFGCANCSQHINAHKTYIYIYRHDWDMLLRSGCYTQEPCSTSALCVQPFDRAMVRSMCVAANSKGNNRRPNNNRIEKKTTVRGRHTRNVLGDHCFFLFYSLPIRASRMYERVYE